MGYRKALEFLIKDYSVYKNPSKQKEILKNHRLSSIIEAYIEDSRIKELAKRGTWLGQDHIHYLRKWDNEDIADLKKIIKMTVFLMSFELEYEKYIETLPKGHEKIRKLKGIV